MKAAVFNRYGGNEVVEIKEMPVPVAARGEAVVKVHATSVNTVDWKVRSGQARIFTGSKFPKVLGCECAGKPVMVCNAPRRHEAGASFSVIIPLSVLLIGCFASPPLRTVDRVDIPRFTGGWYVIANLPT